jgi:hypothetical protein
MSGLPAELRSHYETLIDDAAMLLSIPSGQLTDVGDLLMQAVKIRAHYTTAKYGVKPREGRLV